MISLSTKFALMAIGAYTSNILAWGLAFMLKRHLNPASFNYVGFKNVLCYNFTTSGIGNKFLSNSAVMGQYYVFFISTRKPPYKISDGPQLINKSFLALYMDTARRAL